MGNTVSAHIYEIKVFRPYPVILYRLVEKNWLTTTTQTGPLYPLLEKNWCPSERPKLVHSMVRHLHMYDEMPI